MPRLRKENRVARRTTASERKKKPKMPSRRNEKPLMLKTLGSRASWMQKTDRPPARSPHTAFGIGCAGGQTWGAHAKGTNPQAE